MNFNSQQKKAINTIDGNVAVIATAGSGKTSVLTHRILNMVQNHYINPQSILAITFSKKAKESIENRLLKLNVRYVNVETFHSLALKIIKRCYGTKYKVWTLSWEKEKVLEDICCNELRVCKKEDLPFNEIMTFISKQKTNMLSATDSLIYEDDYTFTNDTMREIYFRYEKFKEENFYIDFDDFLILANEIFDNYSEILNQYKEKFQYVLSDEFQDISLPQFLLLKKIQTKNMMIVGDPLQAIYSFRGGDSKYILNFDSEFSDVKVINLNTNYRCSKDIVATANMLAKNIPDSLNKNYVESIADCPSYKLPELRNFETEYHEANWIAEKIISLRKDYPYKNIAILSRTNAQLQKMEASLHDKKIPFDVVNGSYFIELPEIKLLISYLKLALHENDNKSFRYLYNKPNRWLNKKFLEEVKNKSIVNNTSLYHAMFEIDRRNWRFKNGIDEIFEVINHLRNTTWKSIGSMISYLRQRLDIDKFVTKGKMSDEGNCQEQIENINAFENIANQYDDLKKFIFYLNDIEKQMVVQTNDKVQLSTIHRAKGLEYDVVFIIGCNEELLPHKRNNIVDDEKRLFYVGITRAKKELYLSYVNSYNSNFMLPSSFLDVIRGTLNVITSEND